MIPESCVYLRKVFLCTISKISPRRTKHARQKSKGGGAEQRERRIDISYLNPPVLMVNIVECSRLLAEPLKWVPRERVTAVIITAFHHRETDEPQSLPR